MILAVVVINALVGFYQEHRAEKSLAALRRMLPLRAHVRQGGDKRDIDESTLTGESQPASKQASALPAADLPLGDRLNMAFMNAIVIRGRAELLVTAAGMQTELGGLSRQLALTPEMLSLLQRQLDRLGRRLGGLAVLLVGLRFFLQLARGVNLSGAIAVAPAVAAVPEGLPVVVTVTLALGMHKMAKQRAVVKGTPDVLLARCSHVLGSDRPVPMDDLAKNRSDREYSALASQGLRGLLIASRLLPADRFAARPEPSAWVSGLTFVGLIGLTDPLGAEARQAIAERKAAGTAVKMITGDHRDTDAAIARAAPRHKVRIVQALQTGGMWWP